jgi:hypothetical protein
VAHEIRFRFDQRFFHDAFKRDHLWKGLSLGLWALALFGLAAVVGGAPAATLRDRFFLGAVAVTLVLVAVLRLLAFRRAVRRTHELFRKQSPSGEVHFRLDDDGITIEMDHARNVQAWGGLRRLWRYPDVWLLEVVEDQSILFPARAASAEALAFLLERCRSNGVRS